MNSEIKTLNYLVPQGSCNGPSYFTLYVSAVELEISKDLNLYAFADDHSIRGDFTPRLDEDNIQGHIELNLLNVQ